MAHPNKMLVLNALCAAALLTLSACGGSDDPAPEPTPAPSPAPSPAP